MEKNCEIERDKVVKVTQERDRAREEIKEIRERYRSIIGVDQEVEI